MNVSWPTIFDSAPEPGLVRPGDFIQVGTVPMPLSWWRRLLRQRAKVVPRYVRVVSVSGTTITVEEDVTLVRSAGARAGSR